MVIGIDGDFDSNYGADNQIFLCIFPLNVFYLLQPPEANFFPTLDNRIFCQVIGCCMVSAKQLRKLMMTYVSLVRLQCINIVDWFFVIG